MDEGLQSGAHAFMKKSICILAFSAIAQDARVLRQIKYLSPLYDLTIIGYGSPHEAFADSPNIKWIQLSQETQQHIPNLITALKNHDMRNMRIVLRIVNKSTQWINKLLSWIGAYAPRALEILYWRQSQNQDALRCVLSIQCHAYHANDWNTIPIAVAAARRNRAKLVLDLHEFAPLEYEELPRWWIKKRFIDYILKKYSKRAHATITVATPISERYRDEYGFYPTVIMNAPERISLEPHNMDGKNIRLFHHGGASALRHPEFMIETIAQCDERYSLHFMFLYNEYVEKLKKMSESLAPGRVFFHDPVPLEKIVIEISNFDIGFYILPPTNYNNLFALPNKFLDFICAGLAVCIGPSPSMAEIVRKYSLGVVCNTFDPQDMAAMLNQVSVEEWEEMRQAARIASNELNAQAEMKKLVDIYSNLL
jgi:glycosyltransferase involved in cell wall biosynthesis